MENEDGKCGGGCGSCGGCGDNIKKKLEKYPTIKTDRFCAHCGRGADEVAKLFTDVDVNICDDCIGRLHHILTTGVENKMAHPRVGKLTPSLIFEQLNQYVIGQSRAKKTLSTQVYTHLLKCYYKENVYGDKVEFEKSNIILIGPTGVGKTLLLRTLARVLDVPFAACDANTLTEAGFVGEDVNSLLTRLLQDCKYNVEKAKRGIIFLDEVDKIAKREGAISSSEPSREAVQQALLPMIEGAVIKVPPEKERNEHGHKNPDILLDTSGILFVFGGAFIGLDEIIHKRKEGSKSMGFSGKMPKTEEKTAGEILTEVTTQDLKKYGLIPEFIGRIPVISTLDNLTEGDLVRILTEPKNAIIRQEKEIFRMMEIGLEFTDEALLKIAKLAMEENTGARGLRRMVELILEDAKFYGPDEQTGTKYLFDEEEVITRKPKKIIKEEI